MYTYVCFFAFFLLFLFHLFDRHISARTLLYVSLVYFLFKYCVNKLYRKKKFIRSSHLQVFLEKAALKSFAKRTRKKLSRGLFLINLQPYSDQLN